MLQGALTVLKICHNISEIKKLGETWQKSNKQLSGSVELKKHASYRLPKIIDSEFYSAAMAWYKGSLVLSNLLMTVCIQSRVYDSRLSFAFSSSKSFFKYSCPFVQKNRKFRGTVG